MNDIYKAVIKTKTSYLIHYNHNHDKLGRFAKSNGTSGFGGIIRKYTSEMKDLKEKGIIGKYTSEMKDLKEKGIVGKYASEMKDLIEGGKFGDETPEKSSEITKKEQPLKDVIPVDIKQIDDVVGSAKVSKQEHKCSAFDGDVEVTKWSGDNTIDVSGESTTKTYKREIKTEGGVHFIESKKTSLLFNDVGTSDGSGLDRNKLKELNSYSMSRDSRKALEEGRKLASNEHFNTYKDWSSDPTSRKLPERYNQDNLYRDLYPKEISYRKNKKTGQPEIDSVYFVDKYDNLAGHVLTVYYEDGKPKKTMLEG